MLKLSEQMSVSIRQNGNRHFPLSLSYDNKWVFLRVKKPQLAFQPFTSQNPKIFTYFLRVIFDKNMLIYRN